MRRDRLVPYACAVSNAGAAIALALLSPGTLAEPDVHLRAAFIDRHLLAWRAGWALWMAASTSLLLLFIWWQRKICGGFAPADPRSEAEYAPADSRSDAGHDRADRRSDATYAPGDPGAACRDIAAAHPAGRDARRRRARAALPLAVAGLGLGCDLVGESLQIVAVPDSPAIMAVAVLLTAGVANGLYAVAGALLTLWTGLAGWRAAWTWAVWLAGAAITATALLGAVTGLVVSSALLFLLFCPWCVALERWLRR